MNPRRWTLAVLPAVLLLVSCGSGDGPAGQGEGGASDVPDAAGAPSAGAVPALEVEVVVDGLTNAWDVARAPDGTLLVDEREGGLTAVTPDGSVTEVDADFGDLYSNGETGLMGLVLDPAFAENRRLYTCQGVEEDGGAEIQVIAWTVEEDWSAANRVADPLVGDIPANESSGRHGGCRPRFDSSGALLVGTGDNAVGTNPQDLTSLAGKVLRIDPQTGGPAAGNPFSGTGADGAAADERIYSYGHRNVQGIAVRPGTDQVFTVEQGSDRDDEVNRSQPGGNYGWDPDGAGTYDESVPMTDPDIPGAVPAVWSSGPSTIATSGGDFISGSGWGGYDGVLVVGVQRDTGLLALRLDDEGRLVEQFRVPEFEDTYGRIRTPVMGGDGALYVTTDNGDETDQLLRVTPRS